MEKYMQFSNFDNPHCHQPQSISRRPIDVARSISRWSGKLFRSPLTVVLLVWGFLFLILSIALAYAQEVGHAVKQGRAAVGIERAACDKKTEAVEIFSAGEDPVIPPPPTPGASRRFVASAIHSVNKFTAKKEITKQTEKTGQTETAKTLPFVSSVPSVP